MYNVLYPGIEEENSCEHIPIFCGEVCCKDASHAVPKQVDCGFRMALVYFGNDKIDVFHVGRIIIDMAW